MQAGMAYPFLVHPISSTELLVAGAVLLAIAAVMLAFGRRQKIALTRSAVTDELALQLARIADMLERQAFRPNQPIAAEPLKQIDAPPSKEIAEAPSQKVPERTHAISYSMFGR